MNRAMNFCIIGTTVDKTETDEFTLEIYYYMMHRKFTPFTVFHHLPLGQRFSTFFTYDALDSIFEISRHTALILL